MTTYILAFALKHSFYSEQNIILLITIHLMPCKGGVTDKRMHNMQKIRHNTFIQWIL